MPDDPNLYRIISLTAGLAEQLGEALHAVRLALVQHTEDHESPDQYSRRINAPRTPDLEPEYAEPHGHGCDCFDPPPTGVDGPEPVTYQLPGAPPTERKVTDGGRTWVRHPSGAWASAFDSNPEVFWTWAELLDSYGILTLVPLTPDEEQEAALYGPPGARWGDPHTPCPYGSYGAISLGVTVYIDIEPDVLDDAPIRCVLGVGHVGPHIDQNGNWLGQTVATEFNLAGSAGITPQQAAQTPCTCGNPAQHQPGCPRYVRVRGYELPDTP